MAGTWWGVQGFVVLAAVVAADGRVRAPNLSPNRRPPLPSPPVRMARPPATSSTASTAPADDRAAVRTAHASAHHRPRLGSVRCRTRASTAEGRAAGSLSSMRSMPPAEIGGQGLRGLLGPAAGARSIRTRGSPVPNGPAPVAAYSSVAPRENTSDAGVAASPARLFGGHEARVPTTISFAVRPGVASRCTRHPEVRQQRVAVASNKTFAGLMSRWTTPWRWAAARRRGGVGEPLHLLGREGPCSAPGGRGSRPGGSPWPARCRRPRRSPREVARRPGGRAAGGTSASRRMRPAGPGELLGGAVQGEPLECHRSPSGSWARSTTPMPPRPMRRTSS